MYPIVVTVPYGYINPRSSTTLDSFITAAYYLAGPNSAARPESL
jgi:hypothetical protein